MRKTICLFVVLILLFFLVSCNGIKDKDHPSVIQDTIGTKSLQDPGEKGDKSTVENHESKNGNGNTSETKVTVNSTQKIDTKKKATVKVKNKSTTLEKNAATDTGVIQTDESYFELSCQKEYKHFIIRCSKDDKVYMDMINDTLEANYGRITTDLMHKPSNKTIIEIYSSNDAYHKAMGPDYPAWGYGGYDDGKVRTISVFDTIWGNNLDNFLKTIVHEFTHVVMYDVSHNMPIWLSEGVASYETGTQNVSSISDAARMAISSDKTPTIEDFEFDWDKFNLHNGYGVSCTIIDFIITEYGYAKLNELIKTPDDFQRVFGFSKEEFNKQWVDFLKKYYSSNANETENAANNEQESTIEQNGSTSSEDTSTIN